MIPGETVTAKSIKTGNHLEGVILYEGEPLNDRPTIVVRTFEQGIVRCWGDDYKPWTPNTYDMKAWVLGVQVMEHFKLSSF